jgi:hypothetical protein
MNLTKKTPSDLTLANSSAIFLPGEYIIQAEGYNGIKSFGFNTSGLILIL